MHRTYRMKRLLRLFRNTRGVSPVIAIILLIAIGIAGGSAVLLVLNAANDQQIQAESKLADSESSGTVSVDFSITQLSRDPSLTVTNVTDYSIVIIGVVNTGSKAVYIIDFDISVYGEKLDDYSPWTITGATGATYQSSGGFYLGYKQDVDTTAQYTVQIEDLNNTLGRIPFQTTFTYQIKYGETAGIIEHISQKERISKVIFNAIFYNIALFHYRQNWTQLDASGQWEITLQEVNTTNNLFFLYNRESDAYEYNTTDIVNPINITAFAKKYDVVLMDRWAVPFSIDSILTDLHRAGVPILFYGGLDPLVTSGADIPTKINFTATLDLNGVTPQPYIGTSPCPIPMKKNSCGSQNTYTFKNSLDNVLYGISGQTFNETGIAIDIWDLADVYGFDIANFTTNELEFEVFGTTLHEYHSTSRTKNFTPQNLIYNQTGVILTHKSAVENQTGEVYTYIWKTNEDLPLDRTGDIYDKYGRITSSGHLSSIRFNMLTSVTSAVDRILETEATVVITSINIDFKFSFTNLIFDFEINGLVTEAAVLQNSLTLSLNLPDGINFKDSNETYHLYIDGSLTDAWSNHKVFFNAVDNIMDFDLTWYSGGISAGATFRITVDRGFMAEFNDNDWIHIKDSYTTNSSWVVTGNYISGPLATPGIIPTYTQYIILDNSAWP